MDEDPVSGRKAHQSAKAIGRPVWILLAIAIALGAMAWIWYQHSTSGSTPFAITGVDAAEWRSSNMSQAPATEKPKTLRPEPTDTPRDARPAGPQVAATEQDSGAPRPVAAVTPYSGVANVPLALAASPDSPDSLANVDPGQPALGMVDPATAVPIDGPANDALRRWLVNWQRGATDGKGDGVDLLSPEFQQMVEASSLPCPALYALGHSVGFVEGDKVAAVFYRVALSRAEQDIRSPGERSPSSLRATADALYGMSDTFMRKLKDYPTSERIFGLLQQCEKGNPARQRKATVLCLAAMRLQDPAKAQASAKLLEGLLHDALSADERREVACLLAQSLFDAGKYQEVTAVLTDWQQHDLQAPHVEQGWMLLIDAAVRRGQIEDARQTHALWKQKAGQGRTLPLDQEVANALAGPK